MDRADRHLPRHISPGDRSRTCAAAGTAADSGVVRRILAARVPTRRSPRRWVVSHVGPGPKLEQARQELAHAATEAGRDPAQIAMEGRVSWNGNADDMADGLRSWAEAGASHMSINTMGAGLASVDDHLAALTTAAEIARAFTD